nr:hypothetical protein [uncultured Actinoplanes sp.]
MIDDVAKDYPQNQPPADADRVNAAEQAARWAAVLDTEFGVGRPPIVVLCGSTRFHAEFQEANYRLTMEGAIVLSAALDPRAGAGHGEGVGPDSDEKAALAELHRRKIDLADQVHVLNVDGYIGESTRSEIAYAAAMGKPITFLEGP